MKVLVIVIDGKVIDNSILLLYYTILFSFDYSHQFNPSLNLKICIYLIICQFKGVIIT